MFAEQQLSDHHWKLNTIQQYPGEAIGYMHDLGFADIRKSGNVSRIDLFATSGCMQPLHVNTSF